MNEKELAAYMNAWVMLRAAASTGINFLTRKKAAKEALSYLAVFEKKTNEDENRALYEFARELISSSLKSRSYGSTLFGMVPMRDKDVAQKFAAEIRLVTVEYPDKLGLKEEFSFLYQCMRKVFFELVPEAEFSLLPE